MMPVTSATSPAANHTITQICSSEMPTDSAAAWLSATARKRPADAGLGEEDRKPSDHDRCDDRGRDVEFLH